MAGEMKVHVHAGGTRLIRLDRALSFLSPKQISMIDGLLESVLPDGEVMLKVAKGRLRFVTRTKSYDANRTTKEARE